MRTLILRFLNAAIVFLQRLFSLFSVIKPNSNQAPDVTIINPVAGNIVSDKIIIEYDLIDNESDKIEITVYYEVAGSNKIQAFALTTDPVHEGVSGLSSSPTGNRHVYVWDWHHDINLNTANNVRIHIECRDSVGNSQSKVSQNFSISLPVSVPVPTPPTIQINNPVNDIDAYEVLVQYTISDRESHVVDINGLYSTDGVSFNPMTAKILHPSHDGISALSTNPNGVNYTFVWDWHTDIQLNTVSNVIVKIYATDINGISNHALSVPINISLPVSLPNPPTGTNTPPLATIIRPNGNVSNNLVFVEYLLVDPNSDTLDVMVEYSINGGAYNMASAKNSDPRHENISGLSSSATGEMHGFVWDWQLDITGVSSIRSVIIKITPSDNDGNGISGFSYTFDILDPSVPPPQFPTGVIPFLQLIEPGSAQVIGSDVLISYNLFDPDAKPTDIEISYSVNGGVFETATPLSQDPRHNGIIGLPSSSSGERNNFIWDWQTDINMNQVNNVTLRIIPSNIIGKGQPVTTMPFSIFLVQPPTTPQPVTTPEIVIISPYENIIHSSDIQVKILCADPGSVPVNVELEYAVNGGSFLPATPKTSDSRHEGTQSLNSSSEGVVHTFIWDFQNDLPSFSSGYIQLKAVAQNSNGISLPTLSVFFTLVHPIIHPPSGSSQAGVSILGNDSDVSGTNHFIEYEIIEPNSGNADVEIMYSVAGGAFNIATPLLNDPRHNGTTGLITSPIGNTYGFVWDWLNDLGTTQSANVVIQVRVTISSGQSFTSTTSPLSITVDVQDYKFQVLSGDQIDATPSLYLPEGSIRLSLKNHNFKATLEDVTVYVLEGGGGFLEPRPPAQDQKLSKIKLTTDINGELSVPEFVLGPNPAPNRLLIQHAHTQIIVTVVGSFTNSEIIPIDPVTGLADNVVAQVSTLMAKLHDVNYPMAKIDETKIAIEMENGGGWLRLTEGYGRSIIKESGDNFHVGSLSTITNSVLFSCLLSAREESSSVRLYLKDFPHGPQYTFTLETTKLRILSYRAGTAGNEQMPKTSTGWLSLISRWGVTNIDTVPFGNPNVPVWGPFQILSEQTSGQSTLYPERCSGWGGLTSLMVRPQAPGNFNWKLTMPDFPDDVDHMLSGTVEDRMTGNSNFLPSPPWFVMSDGGGTRDDYNGIEIQLVSGDIQYVGPNSTSPNPWMINVTTKTLQPSDERKLIAVKLIFKVRVSPYNSEIDDPASVGVTPGKVSSATSTGSNEIEIDIPAAPGTHPVSVWYISPELNYDNFIELTARVTIDTKDQNGIWHRNDYNSTILSRAMFFAPRITVTKKDGSDYVEPKEESLIPTPIVNETMNPITPDPNREYYVELRSEDNGQEVDISIPGEPGIKLNKIETNEVYTLYRSKPLLFYIENPEAFGQYQFTLPNTHEYVRLRSPRWFYVNARDAIANNTNNANYWSPVRPFTFLNIASADDGKLTPNVPEPEIILTNLNVHNNLHPVLIENGEVKLRIIGFINDTISDITPGNAGQISEIKANGQSYPINGVNETPSLLRPEAWRGNFDIKVSLEPGIQVIQLEVTNMLDKVKTLQILVDLTDERNDFENPDVNHMKAKVTMLTEPVLHQTSSLAIVNYRMPTSRQTMSVTGTINVSVKSMAASPGTNVEDSVNVNLDRSNGLENNYSGVVLIVPPNVDTQKLSDLQGAGCPILKNTAGTRIHVEGQNLPHIGGTINLQYFMATEENLIRVLVKKPDGSFEERRTICIGDEFTVETKQNTVMPFTPVQLVVGACDSMGQILQGDDRLLMIELDTGPNTGWLRMKSYIDANGNLVNAETVSLKHEFKNNFNQNIAILKTNIHGSLRIGPFLGKKINHLWPVVNKPLRQKINNEIVPSESYSKPGNRSGAINSVVCATGEVVLNETDISLNGRLMGAVIRKNYHSFNDYSGPMGIGWNHNLNIYFSKNENDDFLWTSETGIVYVFSKDSTTLEYKTPRGVFAKLTVKNNDTHCILEWPGGYKQIYIRPNTHSSVWLLMMQYDSAFNKIESIHNQVSLLTTVNDSLDLKLYFEYDDKARINVLSDDTGRKWKYEYHNSNSIYGPEGNMKSFRFPEVTASHNRYPNGKERHYDYQNEPNNILKHNKLKAIQDSQGALTRSGSSPISPVVVMEFTNEGRVTKQYYGLGTYDFMYSTNKTSVSNRRNHITEYSFPSGVNELHLKTLATEIIATTDSGTVTFKTQYNDDGNLTQYETPLQTRNEFDFDSVNSDPRAWNNMLEKRHLPRMGNADPLINTVGISDFTSIPGQTSPQKLTWKWTYEDKYQHVKTSVDALGKTTNYLYDYETSDVPQNHGKVYRVEEPEITTGKHSQAVTTRISYWYHNNFGQIIMQANPLGVVTKFEYYAKNNLRGGLSDNTIGGINTPTARLGRIITDTDDQRITRSPLVTDKETATEKFTYDPWGNIRVKTDRNNNRTTLKHNELGQLIERRNDGGLVEQFWYNINNQQIKHAYKLMDVALPSDANRNRPVMVYNEFEYDRIGNLISEIYDARGLAIKKTFEYDAEDNLWKEFSPNANRAVNPDSNDYFEYNYDPQNRKTKIIHAPNVNPVRQKEINYDEEGKIINIIEDLSTQDNRKIIKTYVYNSWGQQTESKDSYGNKKVQYYDAEGRITYAAVAGSVDGNYPVSQVRVLNEAFNFYNEAGHKVAGTVKAFKWINNSGNWTVENLDSGIMTTQQEFDSMGNVMATISEKGYRNEFRYNGRGKLRANASQLTGEYNATYDPEGNLLTLIMTSPTGSREVVEQRTYNSMNKLLTIHKSGKAKEYKYYDSIGNLRLRLDGKGNRVYQEFDHIGRLTKVTRELRSKGKYQSPGASGPNTLEAEQISRYEYDANGNVLEIKDAQNKKIVSHTYNIYNERDTSTLPDDAFPQLPRPATGVNTYLFKYWQTGNIKEMITPDGILVNHDYDNAGRLIKREVSAAPGFTPVIHGTTLQTYKYDGANRCVATTDNNGFSNKEIRVEFSYDSLNNVWKDGQIQNMIIDNQQLYTEGGYRGNGELGLISYPGSNTPNTRYHYDQLGRMSSVHENRTNSELLNNVYNKHFLDKQSYANNHAQAIKHNSQGVIKSHVHFSTTVGDPPSPSVISLAFLPNQKIVSGEEYVFDDTGYPHLVKDLKENKANLNFYDSMGRVKTVLGRVEADDLTSQPEYGKWQNFDATGNTISSSEGTITKQYSDGYKVVNTTEFLREYNQANQVGFTIESYVKNGLHYVNSHIYWDRRGNMQKDYQYEYQYDVFNRLVRILDKNSGRTIMRNYYDTYDRRIVKNNTRFLYYQNKILEERNSWMIDRFLYDDKGMFMMERDMSAIGATRIQYYVHRDRVGNILFLTNRSGQIIEKYTFNPLTGIPVVMDKDGNEKITSPVCPFLFQGLYYDMETHLFIAGPRFYHPRLKMMMQRDPEGIDHDSNAYSFARNNPNSFTDPTGRLAFIVWLWIVGFFIGGALALVRQIMLWLDGEEDPFSISQIFWAAVAGAVLAPIAYVLPEITGIIFATVGIFSAADEYEKGHIWTATFDAVMAVVGLAMSVRGGAMARFFERHRLGPLEYDVLYPEPVPIKERFSLLRKDKDFVAARYKELQVEHAHRYVENLIASIEHHARRYGLDVDTELKFAYEFIEYTNYSGKRQIDKRFPNPYLRYNPGMEEGGVVYIDLAYFIPISIQRIFVGGRIGAPKNLPEIQELYPSVETVLAHEYGHTLGGSHNTPIAQDASTMALFNLYMEKGVISKKTALQLMRSIDNRIS